MDLLACQVSQPHVQLAIIVHWLQHAQTHRMMHLVVTALWGTIVQLVQECQRNAHQDISPMLLEMLTSTTVNSVQKVSHMKMRILQFNLFL